jgi:hypothetical protein
MEHGHSYNCEQGVLHHVQGRAVIQHHRGPHHHGWWQQRCRLGVSLDNIGKPAVDVTSSGWSLTPANVNIINGLLEAECITKPDSPVAIYAMDNECFMIMSSDGTISPFKKLEDGKYHVVGDLAITPGILLRPMYAALDKIVKLCGERRIYILTSLPRYILVQCCDDDKHCINLVVKDAASRQGIFDIMDELDLIGKAVSIKFASCTVLNTGDLLVGKRDATRHEVLDAMIAHWMNDPVHGTKAGYSKLSMKLAERVEADLVPKAITMRTVLGRQLWYQLPAKCSRQGRARHRLHIQSGVAPEPERGVAPQLHSRRWAWRRRPRKRPRVQILLLERVCSEPAHSMYRLSSCNSFFLNRYVSEKKL